jgi:hypothetical protein
VVKRLSRGAHGYTGAVERPTTRDIDELWSPATPQFAYQIADRMAALIADLPPSDPVRVHAERRLLELDRLGHEATKGEDPQLH